MFVGGSLLLSAEPLGVYFFKCVKFAHTYGLEGMCVSLIAAEGRCEGDAKRNEATV